MVYTGIVTEPELKGVTIAEACEMLEVGADSDGSTDEAVVMLAESVSNAVVKVDDVIFPLCSGGVVSAPTPKHSSHTVSTAPEPSLVV